MTSIMHYQSLFFTVRVTGSSVTQGLIIEGQNMPCERSIICLSGTASYINVHELVFAYWIFNKAYPQNTNTEAKEGNIACISADCHKVTPYQKERKHMWGERPTISLSETVKYINIHELVFAQYIFNHAYPQNINTESKEGINRI